MELGEGAGGVEGSGERARGIVPAEDAGGAPVRDEFRGAL